jgi:hypothetical protein
MAQQRGGLRPTRMKSTTATTSDRKTTGAKKLDADKRLLASELLTAAANRQLAAYARIRHNRQKGK